MVALRHWQKRLLCAFNHDGDCVIYPVRPVACRNAHAIGTHVHCAADDPSFVPATRLAYPPLDRLVERSQRELRDAHAGPPAALCDAVFRLLAT